jgi:hypothetical protein
MRFASKTCTMSTGSFPGVKSGGGVTMIPHPLLVPRSWKSRAIPLHPLWAVLPVQSLSACTVELYLYSPYGPYGSVQSLSACTVDLYLYSPYGPYCLYRASVSVQGCTVRPVQSLSACTGVHRTACTESQCLYKAALYLFFIFFVENRQNISRNY